MEYFEANNQRSQLSYQQSGSIYGKAISHYEFN